MPSVGMNIDISSLIDATASGNIDQIIAVSRELTQRGADPSELIGRMGMIAAHGDSDGHTILTLDAASMMCRWLLALQYTLGENALDTTKGLPFLVQAASAAAPAVHTGKEASVEYPAPFFPSSLSEGQTVNSAMHDAVFGNDRTMVERLMLGLYGTGADYRTLQIRVYDSISTTFQHAGHPLIFAVRGMQLLDSVEWGDRTPNIIDWLAPHLSLHDDEPAWVHAVRSFLAEDQHSLVSYRTRLAAPEEANALPLRSLILSDADTPHICQGVFDALIKNGASSRGVGSVIALAATDLMQRIDDSNRNQFIDAAHSLLFTAAVRLVFSQTQEVEALPLLFIAASYLNVLYKELGEFTPTTQAVSTRSPILGGGLIGPALLDSLAEQLEAQDLAGAFSTSRRYIQLGHDPRSLFAVIGLSSARADAATDQGHTMQIVQAAGEEYTAWPTALSETNIEGFLHVALRAAAFAQRNSLVDHL